MKLHVFHYQSPRKYATGLGSNSQPLDLNWTRYRLCFGAAPLFIGCKGVNKFWIEALLSVIGYSLTCYQSKDLFLSHFLSINRHHCVTKGAKN